MRTITVEEHFVTPGFLSGPGQALVERTSRPGDPFLGVLERLREAGPARVAEMDAAGIDVQVLSLTSPGAEQSDAAEAAAVSGEANDFIAAAMASHPGRFSGFATLPIADPPKAAAELERTVGERNFKGAAINGHHRGRYLDDKFFWPIFECAQSLRVPIYLHPTQPPDAVVTASYSGFNPAVNYFFANSGWGWHIETAVHALRLILGGVFDQFPDLQIIFGHLGEALPFMMQRADVMTPAITGLKRPITAYLRENVYYSTSAFNFTAPFLDLFLQVGADRILFSADYPFGSMAQARAFLDQLPLSPNDRERIASGNAEHLLGLSHCGLSGARPC